MDIITLIKNRYAVRHFAVKELDETIIEKVLTAVLDVNYDCRLATITVAGLPTQ